MDSFPLSGFSEGEDTVQPIGEEKRQRSPGLIYMTPFSVTTKEDKDEDLINHPSHYAEGRKFEPIEVIEDWELPYHLSTVIRYISRCQRKSNEKQDLEKARWYLDRYLKITYGD